MTAVLGCIADDFTGATDLASLLARSGAPVKLRIGVPKNSATDPAPFEVIALKCRTSPVSEAVEECLKAVEWLRSCGAKHYFWKYCSTFDSTPRGNIGPVSEALMSALGAKQTIYCPAFPENGRSIFMGNLFVGQQPLAESPMKDHPLTPMRDSNLMRLLEPQVMGNVGLIDRLSVAKGEGEIKARLEELKQIGIAHTVVDAVSNTDLETIANACFEMPLLTGGSALAMTLPHLYRAAGLLEFDAGTPPIHETSSSTIVLSGSCSAMTNAQVAHYVADGRPTMQLNPIALAREGMTAVLDWVAQQDFERAPLIYATAKPEDVKQVQSEIGVEQSGVLVEKVLAQAAVVARNHGARRFIVAGGETSGAVTKALSVDELDIGPEIAPGVPWTFCQSKGQTMALTLKSGNFGKETFFNDATGVLERA